MSGVTGILGLLLLFPLAIKLVGAEAYGLWVLTIGMIQLLGMSDFGLGTGVVLSLTSIEQEKGSRFRRRQFVSTALWIFFILAIVLTVAYAVLFPLYLRTITIPDEVIPTVVPMVALAGLTLLIGVMGRACNAVLWAEDRPDIERKAAVFAILLRGLGYGALVPFGADLMHVVVVECLSLMVPPVVCAVAVQRRYPLCRVGRSSWAEHARPLLSRSSVLSIGALSQIGLYQLPLFVVGPVMGLNAATAFGALMRVYQSVRLVVSWVSYPYTYPIRQAAEDEVGRHIKACFDLTLTMGLLMAVPLLALPTQMLEVWLGQEFVFAAPALALLTIGVLAESLAQPAELTMNLRGRPLAASLLRLTTLIATVPAVLFAASTGDIALVMLATVLPSSLMAWLQVLVAFRAVPLEVTPREWRRWCGVFGAAVVGVMVLGVVEQLVPEWPAILICGLLSGTIAINRIRRIKDSK